MLENEKILTHRRSCNPAKSIGKCSSVNEMSPEPEFISPEKYAEQTTLNTHALITKNRFEVLSESGEDYCNKSVNTPVKLVKRRPNEDLNRVNKEPSLFLIQCYDV